MNWNSCIGQGFWCYAFSYEALGALAYGGLLLTLIGLAVAVQQSMKARTAADAAASAAGNLQFHLDSVNLAYLSAQMNTVLHLVKSNDCELAHVLFGPIKRSIRIYANSTKQAEIDPEGLNRTIGKINAQLDFGRTGNSKFNALLTSRHLDELLMILADWEGSATRIKHEGIGHANT